MRSSQDFAQYLINSQEITGPEARQCLQASVGKEVGLPLRALYFQAIKVDDLNPLMNLPPEAFRKAVTDRGILSESTAKNLEYAIPKAGLPFAQAMLDLHLADLEKLERLFRVYQMSKSEPIPEAVAHLLAGREMEREAALYADYVTVFFDALYRFLGGAGVIRLDYTTCLPEEKPRQIVAQRISGGIALVVGIEALEKEFLALARRYSREELPEMDELALDSMEEFLNVVDGLFAVKLGKRELEVDLALPVSATEMHRHPSNLLRLFIDTPWGGFDLLLATDAFI